MAEGLKLEELEAYRVELNNAQREGRPCKYKNPREVYAEDPNRDSYLEEKDEATLTEEQDAINSQNNVYLKDPGQEFAEASAVLSNADNSPHQNLQAAPNPENLTTDGTAEEDYVSDEEDYVSDEAALEDSNAGELPSEITEPTTTEANLTGATSPDAPQTEPTGTPTSDSSPQLATTTNPETTTTSEAVAQGNPTPGSQEGNFPPSSTTA